MVDFKKDGWVYALLAAVLGIVAIFIPMGVQNLGGGSTEYGWLGGYSLFVSGGTLEGWYGLLVAALFLFGVTISAATALLIYSVNTWRGKEFKWTFLIYLLSGLAMIVFVILLWVFEFDPDVIPIAPIFILISGILAFGAGVLEKIGKRT